MEKKVIHAALLGFGTVGTGVYKVLKNQEEEMEAKLGSVVRIKKIMVRNLERQRQRWKILLCLQTTGKKLSMIRILILL